MTTRIRLRRMGSNKRPFFRVVVADQRSPRDGRFIENIGKYHPLDDPSVIEIDQDRALHWLRVGAQPSNQVRNLMNKIGIWDEFVKERPSAALEPRQGAPGEAEGLEEGEAEGRGRGRPARDSARRGAEAAERLSRRPSSRRSPRRTPRRPWRPSRPPRPPPRRPRAEAAAAEDDARRGGTRTTRSAEEAHPLRKRRRRGRVKDLVEFLVQELVDEPDAVSVEETFDERGPRYRVRVAPEDMGKVIGRGGRTAKAIRTVVRAAAQRQGHGAMVDIED